MASWWLWMALYFTVLSKGESITVEMCPSNITAGCYYDNIARYLVNPPRSSPSDIFAIGALFDIRTRSTSPYSCNSGFNPVGLLLSQAFLWSIEYWQKQLNRAAQENVSVGGVVFDTCTREEQLIQNLLSFEQCNIRVENIDRISMLAWVGPLANSQAIVAASLSNELELPLISPTVTSPEVNDKTKYSFFMRTTPSIAMDVAAMGSILTDLIHTKYVAVIYQQESLLTHTFFVNEMIAKGICITDTFLFNSSTNFRDFVANTLPLLESTKYIALLLTPDFAGKLIANITVNYAVRGKHIFLFTSEIKRDSGIFTGNSVVLTDAILLERTKLDAVSQKLSNAIDAFRNYWTHLNSTNMGPKIENKFLATYLNMHNSLPLFDEIQVQSTLMATDAIVTGVYEAGKDSCSNPDDYMCDKLLKMSDRGVFIRDKILSTGYFIDKDGNLTNPLGDLKASLVSYSVLRYSSNSFQMFGNYKPSLGFTTTLPNNYVGGTCATPCIKCGESTTTPAPTTKSPSVTSTTGCGLKGDANNTPVYYPPNQEITGAYSSAARADSEYLTRFDFGYRWIIALGVLAGLGILSVFIFEIYILYKLLGTRMGQKWRTMWLGQLLLFGLFMCYLTLFAYLPTPTKATCGITRFGVGVSYSICFAVLLVKLMVILTSRTTENALIPGDIDSPNYLKGIYQFLMFVFAVGVQVVIDIQWLITVPPEAVKVLSNSGQQVWVCNHFTWRASSHWTNMPDFVRTEFENHILSLIYIMFLIFITTILALKAHGIITNHRESVFIGIAAGFSIPIWLAWTLVGGLNRDHAYAHEFGDACIAFGLFLTATLILFSMFLPKVRQLVNMGLEGIYFEDDRDTYYAGSVIMPPPSYKSRPNSVIYVNNQGIYSEPVIIGNGDPNATYIRHPGVGNPLASSVYSAPPTYLKKGGDSTIGPGSRVLRMTDDLSGKRPLEKKRTQSEVAYGTVRPRSTRGTLPRSRSQSNLGAL